MRQTSGSSTPLSVSRNLIALASKGFDRGFDRYYELLALSRIGGRMDEPSLDYPKFAIAHLRDGADPSYFQAEKLKTAIRGLDKQVFGFINLN